jgi:hypothetical protein
MLTGAISALLALAKENDGWLILAHHQGFLIQADNPWHQTRVISCTHHTAQLPRRTAYNREVDS